MVQPADVHTQPGASMQAVVRVIWSQSGTSSGVVPAMRSAIWLGCWKVKRSAGVCSSACSQRVMAACRSSRSMGRVVARNFGGLVLEVG